MSDLRLIGPLAYQGKTGCDDVRCTRIMETGSCYGWHCSYCDEPCSSQGHRCDAAEAILGESKRMMEDTP